MSALQFQAFNALNQSQWASITAIEAASHVTPWSAQQLGSSPAAGYIATALLDAQANVLGYSLFMPNVDDWELLNITVAPQHRGAGLGRQLMGQGISAARAAQVSGVFLEVRPSNAAALALYQASGFQTVGRRKHYYKTAVPQVFEDALILRLELAAAIYNTP
jgi:[ribosomal protein S18]-alanine N-acetyltransferase